MDLAQFAGLWGGVKKNTKNKTLTYALVEQKSV